MHKKAFFVRVWLSLLLLLLPQYCSSSLPSCGYAYLGLAAAQQVAGDRAPPYIPAHLFAIPWVILIPTARPRHGPSRLPRNRPVFPILRIRVNFCEIALPNKGHTRKILGDAEAVCPRADPALQGHHALPVPTVRGPGELPAKSLANLSLIDLNSAVQRVSLHTNIRIRTRLE